VFQVFNYIGRFQTARAGFSGLPAWARFLVFLAAIPGVVLAVLSILGLVVSIFVLCLLAVPVYRLLRLVCFTRQNQAETSELTDVATPSGRRRVDAKIVE
jgi:Flp pilus assembly protein TadB